MDAIVKIGECEMLAAALAIVIWIVRSGGTRDISLRADNQNVFHWVRKVKANHGKANRIIKFVIDLSTKRDIEAVSQYLRIAHYISADGLGGPGNYGSVTPREDDAGGVHAEWIHALNVTIDNADGPLRITQIRGQVIGFLRDRNNNVCEWRPGCYTTDGLLWNWGSPCWAFGTLRPSIRSLVDLRVQERTVHYDIFVLIGRAYAQLQIDDFKRDERYIIPRYAISITPSWVQDRRLPGDFWTRRRLLDSAGLGDVCSAQWRAYGRGPADSHFDFPPFARDIRVLHHGYADDGLPGADDPVGVTRVTGIPNSIGRKVTIRAGAETTRVSRFPNFPMPDTAAFRGANAHWPLISHGVRIPYISDK